MSTWLLLLIPLASAVVITLVTRPNRDLSSYISIGAIGVCLLIALPKLFYMIGHPHMTPVESSFTWLDVEGLVVEMGTIIDPLSILMLFIVTFVGSLIHIYSRGYMEGDPGFSRFFACLSLFIFAMLGIVLANNFIMIFVFWELVGLASYLLIGYYYEKPSAADAAKKAFLVNRVGDFGFILGIIVLFYAAGTFNFLELEHLIHEGHIDDTTLLVSALLIFCGAVGKSAQIPLHVWLPDAMEGPTPVSALIHAATMVAAGVYMLARTAFLFHAAPESASLVVAYVGGATALMAALIALAQDDIKRIIAFSTLSSLGYMVMSVGLGGVGPGMFYLTTHAFFKALLFLGAGSVIHACHTNNIWEMGRLWPKMRITAVTFLLGSLAMMGVFPFSGFWSKDEILATAWDNDIVLFGVGVATAFFTAVFMTRLIVVTFFGDKRYHGHPHESPPVMTVPLMVLAFFAVTAGFVGLPSLDPNFGTFFGGHGGGHAEGAAGGHHFNFLVAGLSTAAVFAGIVIGWLVYVKETVSPSMLQTRYRAVYDMLAARFYFDDFYDNVLVAGVYNGIARVCNFLEVNFIINFLVNGTAYLTRETGKALRLSITGKTQHYAYIMVGGALVLAFVFIITLGV
ncbi:MAG TPA: NADH-quinone oxidoreductase subunit L [Deltaproteobacteria bacterium]|nr:NADH-quinone oxidoreductase subunit L [Deltaproteobacteria bacterium]